MWSKPNYIELDRKTVMERINAKAWTIGQAMSYGQLCDKGVGAKGVIQLPDGTIAEAYVAGYHLLLGLYELIVKGDSYYFDPLTGAFF